MSKRPKTAGSLLSRLRRPAGRLRDMPIWSKLGLIMIVPTIATVVVGTSGLVDHLGALNDANRAGDLAELIGHSGELVDGLQDERTAAVLLLSVEPQQAGQAESEAKKKATAVYSDTSSRVDEAKGPYSRQRADLADLPVSLQGLLAQIDERLGDLPGARSQVLNGKFRVTDALQSYDELINQLLTVRDSASQLAGDNDLSDRMRAAAAVAREKEWLSIRRVVVHRALDAGGMSATLRTDYISSETGQLQAQQSFSAVATEEEEEFHAQTIGGGDRRQATIYISQVNADNSQNLAGVSFTPEQWDAALVANGKLIRSVEQKFDSDVVTQAGELRSDVQRQVFLETGLLLTMLLLAIFLAFLVARSMARSLRELRQGALSIAQYGLPQAVARLRDPQVTGQLSPVQLANQIAEPLPVRSKDEFGQVTEAFNAVHLEAVRTAAEQAALRASVATMFVNLARRSQILVDRLIGHLDRLERGEEDPDRLAELFQLDHLATRMRRNDENLLVLAGADSTRVQREPAALIDVLRAAQSEVEHYTRIEFGVIDRDIEVAAHAVNDLVHLVAELFDNATAFSPPDSQVLVEARRVGDRASLYVEDRGIGISGEQLADLNERLATPPQVDVAVSRMMGLVVVARLASRHGVKVELRPGSDRGTVADCTLPPTVLVPRALSGRGLPAAALPAAAGPPSGPNPAFGALPALGNGASAPSAPATRPPGGSGNQVTLGGRPFDPASRNGSGTPATVGSAGNLPAWSDLTGASGTTGGNNFPPRTSNGHSVDPLPQRRSTDEPGVTGQQPTIPRQLPSSPEAGAYAPPAMPPVSSPPVSGTPYSAPPVSAAPVSGQPVSSAPVSSSPVSTPPGSPLPQRPVSAAPAPGGAPMPPAWPPVAGEPAAPPVPERLAAALDMTTELPRVQRQAPAARPVSAPQPTAPTPPQAQNRQRYADETMELPIFRELESAWFRTRRPGPEESAGARQPATAGAATQQLSTVDVAGRSVQQNHTGTTGNVPMAQTPTAAGGNGAAASGGPRPGAAESRLPHRPAPQENRPPHRSASQESVWQTAADDGWRAASAASQAPPSGTTETGLPKRTPMAQLVPGAVEKPTTSVQRRNPESVRGLLSAYHRGVQRGRSHPSDSNPTGPEGTPGGQQSSQSGSGPMAGSGQKEQEG
ncbi:nitrate- and nitrite sensing domain-containing protein [Micromonospora sp. WMMD1082]|uniref:sensor histidine kinase n=1 Tax=Micromonospora sp. WMMD1082 TaxID=3016104 RepID=UPI0024165DAD|nr:nitrate- and nitrite sensing domain-containing protein [Micromonospora sp. WMMD1082]MDG4793377.1 nitrate- and nitrite sensing domain-containing protein [Micromonospora sp. WMMD1082]